MENFAFFIEKINRRSQKRTGKAPKIDFLQLKMARLRLQRRDARIVSRMYIFCDNSVIDWIFLPHGFIMKQ